MLTLIKNTLILASLLFQAALCLGDGLLMPEDENYPGDFLRKRSTDIHVEIDGLVARTTVTMEFENEWDETVDAVFSFPLPPAARATQMLYERNDTTFVAVLRVRPQTDNPGEGEGGIAALVTQYIGHNGLKMKLAGIIPGTVQKIELSYLSNLDLHRGICRYRFPLETQDFTGYALDHVQFSASIRANRDVTAISTNLWEENLLIDDSGDTIFLETFRSHALLTNDFELSYTIADAPLSFEIFSADSDSMDGHFALFIRPPSLVESELVMARHFVFLLNNSSSMSGYKLEQSKEGIRYILEDLVPGDTFTIIPFDTFPHAWTTARLPATPDNINDALDFLSTIAGSGGIRIDRALIRALEFFEQSLDSQSILLFSDGRSPLNPDDIATLNTHQIGIFPVAFGADVDREKLEMTAQLNHGFVSYLEADAALPVKMQRLAEKLSRPLLSQVELVVDESNIYSVIPQQLTTVFAGSFQAVTGRYQQAGESSMEFIGQSRTGVESYQFDANLSENDTQSFTESIWAKEAIDDLERQISVYGVTEALRDSLISLSLRYRIRCRYTAYFEDYETVQDTSSTGIDEELVLPQSFIDSSYPNPFNLSTTLKIYLHPADQYKSFALIKIYNMLGQLVRVIDLGKLGAGWHLIPIEGRDHLGRPLASGVYIVQLQLENQVYGTTKIVLIK